MKKLNNKKFKAMWTAELDTKAPQLSKKVMDTPIMNSHNNDVPSPEKPHFSFSTKRWTAIVAAACSLLLIVGLCFVFIHTEDDNIIANNPVPMAITVDINPSSTFLADENGNVINVISLNADADVVRSTENFEKQIIGHKLEEAIVNYVDMAAKLGYFKPSDDAVRISTSDENRDSGRILQINDSLVNYFCEKGIYAIVAFDYQKPEEFAGNIGVPVMNIYEELKNLNAFYSERIADGISANDIKNIYEQIVSENMIIQYVRENIRQHINYVAENLHLLSDISSLNRQIKQHKDNPVHIIESDYWSVRKMVSENKYTEEFAALMTLMENKLSEYEKQCGTKIDNVVRLNILITKYSFLGIDSDISEIKKKIEEYTDSNFCDKLYAICELFPDEKTEKIKDLLSAPSTREEYRDKVFSYLGIENKTRTKTASDDYNKVRKSISEHDYKNYMESIEKKYGSLLNYFENQK